MIALKNIFIDLQQNKGFIKYFKNTSWLLVGNVFKIIIVLVSSIIIARYLGPQEFGILSYAISIVGIFSLFASLGIDSLIVRELTKTPALKNKLLGTSFVLKFIGSLVSILLVILFIHLNSNDSKTNSIIIILSIGIIFQSFNIIDSFFQSQVKGKLSSYAMFISLTIGIIIKILLVLLNAPLIAFAVITVIEIAILAITYMILYLKHIKNILDWKFSISIAKKLIRDGWPLIFTSVVLIIQARIDQVMLMDMVGPEEVGQYSVALILIEGLGFLPMVLRNSLYPAIVESKISSQTQYKRRLSNYYRLNFILFIIVATPLYFLSQYIVIFLYGIEYKYAGLLLSLFSVRLFFTNMGIAKGTYILTENLLKYSLFTMSIGTIVNISLNYVLIPHYHAVGSIIATIISFAVTIFLIDLFYHRTRDNIMLLFKSIFTFYKINIKNI